jgi:hypothetical protein
MTLSRAISKLRELNEEVPKPPRLPTPDEVADAERRLLVKFHPDFRQYLLEASDVVYGTSEPVTITDPDSHTHLDAAAKEAWEMGVPRDLLPICEDNGDYFCMNQRGQVVYWSHNGTTDEKWPDLANWIANVWLEGEAADEENDEEAEEEENK